MYFFTVLLLIIDDTGLFFIFTLSNVTIYGKIKLAAILDFDGHFESFLIISQLGTTSYWIRNIKKPLYANFLKLYTKFTTPVKKTLFHVLDLGY